MKIQKLICSPGLTGFYFDDQQAIKAGAVADGNFYKGKPITPGFTNVRQKGESISVMLVMEDGQIAHGDCAAVQYSGMGGRDPLFIAEEFIPVIQREFNPMLSGKEITTFREMAEMIDAHIDAETGKPMHTAIRYGLTQAILDAVAKSKNQLMASVIADEYGCAISDAPVPIFCQSGDDRYNNADKMIMKQLNILPHALINNIDKLGENGEKLAEYIMWLRERIKSLRTDESYAPLMHIDVYGTFGIAFNNDLVRIADYMGMISDIAKPFKLRIEGPVDMGGRDTQISALARLKDILFDKGIGVEIVADEWCNLYSDVVDFADQRAGDMLQIKAPDLGGINNIIKAVLYCKEKGIGAYIGGSCNETDRSAQVCAHIAMATQPDLILAKPGMGVDEGYMIIFNEMQRIINLKINGYA